MVLLPKMHSWNLIIRKHPTDSNKGTLTKYLACIRQKYQCLKRQRKILKLFQSKGKLKRPDN